MNGSRVQIHLFGIVGLWYGLTQLTICYLGWVKSFVSRGYRTYSLQRWGLEKLLSLLTRPAFGGLRRRDQKEGTILRLEG